MVPGFHKLIQGNNFRVLVEICKNLKIKQLENKSAIRYHPILELSGNVLIVVMGRNLGKVWKVKGSM